MANVLKYLTGALSKRAKRRGNLAVGIGEENYGPSSTTGYYAGVTPPDSGFVVYATGSNNNPKVFVANSENDLPAIARTLGGGELSVLGAKNYIAGLTHAWVIDSVPNNTVTDGLVLDLNAKNPTSFLDNEPTDNLFGTTAMEFKDDAGIYTNDIISGTDSIGDYFIKDVNNAPWWSGLRIYNNNIRPLTAGVSYVLSFECRSGQTGWSWAYDSNASGGGWSGNDQGRLSNTNLVFDKTGGTVYTSDMANTWQRVSYRVTMKDASVFTGASAFPHDSFFTNTNNVQIYYRNAQLEVGRTEATDYSSGARLQNTTIYDLSGNGNNGTLANGASYDSGSNSIVFDGTDDEVTVPDSNTLDLTTAMSFEFLFKADSSQNNPYPRLIDKSSYLVHILQTPPFGIYQNVNTSAGLRQTGTTSNTIQADKWNHVISNYDGQIGKIYINGELVRTRDFGSVLACTTNGTTLTIGGDTGTSRQFNGKIAKTRIYNKALSESEAYQNYYGGPIVTDGLVFATDAGNLVSYESGSTTTYSLTGSDSGILTNGVGFDSSNGGVFIFDGANEYIRINAGSALGTSQITVAAWVYPTEDATTGARTRGAVFGGPGALYLGLWPNSSAGSSAIHTAVQTTSGRPSTQTGTIYTNQWSYLLATYDGANFKTYLNGEYVTQTSQTGTISAGSTYYIGTYSALTDGNHNFPGKISCATIYNRSLSEEEVLQNYNAQKARFGK